MLYNVPYFYYVLLGTSEKIDELYRMSCIVVLALSLGWLACHDGVSLCAVMTCHYSDGVMMTPCNRTACCRLSLCGLARLIFEVVTSCL